MTQLVLHIGDPKTGTSSIQTALFERRLACPTVQLVSPPELSEAKLAATLFEAPRRKDRITLLREKAQWLAGTKADVAVLSAEQFSHVQPKVMRNALNNHLPDYVAEARVVAYVRPHAQRILSGYAQQTKCGTSIKSPDAFHAYTQAHGHFVYGDRFADWHTVFGAQFILRPMVRSQLTDGDVTRDFFNVVLDGAPFTLDTPETMNTSLTLQQLACVREIQIVLRQQEIRQQVRVAIGSHFGLTLNTRGTGIGDKINLHRELAETIARDYVDDATRMDAMFFDAPLMQEALADAVTGAIPDQQPYELKHHTTAGRSTALRATAATLAQALHHDGVGWKNTRLKSIGQTPRKMPQTSDALASVARVTAILDDLIAQIDVICA